MNKNESNERFKYSLIQIFSYQNNYVFGDSYFYHIYNLKGKLYKKRNAHKHKIN